MPSLPSVLSLIPFTSVKGTVCFTFAALLIILAWRITYIDLPKAGIHIGFYQNQSAPAAQASPSNYSGSPIATPRPKAARP